ncbi:pyroglutamyl-peptidase I [Dielma fastidiosa]|uniref:pyroglutamyl-peptidase I n=1 Tax=Dielma fastidiosa TaxID=1034346 RepID=UPI000E49EB25|nr:pyroglutamyl-peptidase I [Dielma fastidiosa]RHM96630.1 pyroglutamyl-peptidase I [Dielma fastidiosa]
MKLLVTGFDPFGGEKINPAIESVKLLADEIGGAEIIKLEIPTVFNKSLAVIEKAVREYQPDVVLSIGQAGGRSAISVEYVGINLNEARIKDNEGYQPSGEKIYEDGENAYFATVPVKAMTAAMKAANVPAAISYTAGTFVCNHVLYGVRYLAEKEFPAMRSGFIHIPFLPEQVLDKANTPSMSLDLIVRGLTAAIEAIVSNEKDIQARAGETH